ncbi:hypothetical protein PMIN06_008801 [Paraphaeosphaeria minitans]|uniref:Uncharacterized protein n=1 Tax=Paraphaeosphaeria minitans TaxID=565426 RepID=A0A9P6G883_9PLEO|nr:hypothetical protein PMIN01_11295 [Paraphaeosphaeria minitans]
MWQRGPDHSRKLQHLNNTLCNISFYINWPTDGVAGTSEASRAAFLGARTQLGDGQTTPFTRPFASSSALLRRSSRPREHPHLPPRAPRTVIRIIRSLCPMA